MSHEGQIIKKGPSKYQIRIALGTDSRGKRRYFTQTINATLTQAKAFLRQKLRERDTGTIALRNDGLLGDWMTYWLDQIASTKVRSVTLDQYRYLAKQYILPTLGDHRVGDLNRSHIEEWIAAMSSRHLSARTMRLARSVLHNALESLVARGELTKNATKGVTLKRPDRAEITPLTVEQAQCFQAGIAGTPYEALWALLLTTGMRPAEALALRWKDIQEGDVRVTRSLTWTSAGPTFGDPKTPTGRRRISLPTGVLALLGSRRERSCHRAEDDLVFSTQDGGPLDWRVLRQRHFKPLIKRLGLPNIRAYDLRHTCTTLLLEAGVNPTAIAERLGHKSSAFLLDTYGHVLPHQQREATARLGALLEPQQMHDAFRQDPAHPQPTDSAAT